jgi:hypothetical protein
MQIPVKAKLVAGIRCNGVGLTRTARALLWSLKYRGETIHSDLAFPLLALMQLLCGCYCCKWLQGNSTLCDAITLIWSM